MERRTALKNIGLSLGLVVATPTVLSLLQQCKTAKADWQPLFYTEDQGRAITALVDLILPTTQASPGALDVNVPQFIDLYVHKTYTEDQKASYKAEVEAMMLALTSDRTANQLSTQDYDNLLKQYLKGSAEDRKGYTKSQKLVYACLNNLRDRAVWGYRTSQKIGEEVLAYDPVPGKQIGCGDLQELTGGKRWSL